MTRTPRLTQPLERDPDGTVRFTENAIVRRLLDTDVCITTP